MDDMVKVLYEKIGRQEIVIEGLKNQMASLSSLLAKLVSGEEKIDNWEITANGQLTKKDLQPKTSSPKQASTSKKWAKK